MVELSDTMSFRIQCKFLSGSNAQACLVVLVSDTENTTVILTRDADEVEMDVTMPLLSVIHVQESSWIL